MIVVSSEGINFGTILALGHRLRPDARLVLVDGRRVAPRAPPLPADARDVFVLDPTADFLAALAQQQHAQAQLVFADFHLSLWRLSRGARHGK